MIALQRHYWWLGFVLALSQLTACGWSGRAPGWDDVTIDTNRKGVLQVEAELRGQYLLLENLIDNGVFDDNPAPARKAKNLLDRARGYQRAAWASIRTQDPNTALGEDMLSNVNQILQVVSAILGDAGQRQPLPE